MRGDELETTIEARRAKYLEEIDELEVRQKILLRWKQLSVSYQCSLSVQNYIYQLEEEEADLNLQMKEQSEDNEELLNQKMALDIEIAAYR